MNVEYTSRYNTRLGTFVREGRDFAVRFALATFGGDSLTPPMLREIAGDILQIAKELEGGGGGAR